MGSEANARDIGDVSGEFWTMAMRISEEFCAASRRASSTDSLGRRPSPSSFVSVDPVGIPANLSKSQPTALKFSDHPLRIRPTGP